MSGFLPRSGLVSSLRTPPTRRALTLAVLAFGIIWLACLPWTLSPFDWDESLYRRMAEEMKATGNFLLPRWDGEPVYDKPPTYLWLILAVSRLVDGAQGGVSVVACRLTGVLATLGVLALLAAAWPGLVTRREAAASVAAPASAANGRAEDDGPETYRPAAHPLFPVFLFGLALLPFAGACAVLLDALLMLALTPSLLVLTRLSLEAPESRVFRSPRLRETLVLSASMAAGAAVKGAIGIVLPGFAVALALALGSLPEVVPSDVPWVSHLASFLRRFLARVLSCALALGPAFAGAIALAVAFYALIWFSGGETFVREFFITHHLRRAIKPMEGHGGPFFYHFVIIAVGGLPLTAALALLVARPCGKARGTTPSGKARATRLFPFAWALAVPGFFAFSATKLPNYSWPVWPALALLVAFLYLAEGETLEEPREGTELQASARMTGVPANDVVPPARRMVGQLAVFVPGLLGLALAAAGLVIGSLQKATFERSGIAHVLDPKSRAVIFSLLPIAPEARLGVFGLALGFLILAALTARTLAHAATPEGPRARLDFLFRAAAVEILILFCASRLVAPLVEEALPLPYTRLTTLASRLLDEDPQPSLGHRLVSMGDRSPTISSAFRNGVVLRAWRDDPAPFADREVRFVLIPVWYSDRCAAHDFPVRAQDRFVVLCERRAPAPPSGPH